MAQRSDRIGRRGARRFAALTTLLSAALAICALLSACAPDANQAAAAQGKSKLDKELTHAKQSLGIPESLLKPIETQEQRVAAGENGFGYNYQSAASNYALLYSQLLGIEQTAAQTLKSQAQQDIQAFAQALDTRRAQGFTEVSAYQARLSSAEQQLNAAQTAGDFAAADALIRTQTAALNALWPAYLKLQDFKAALRAVRASGVNTSLGEVEYTQDEDAFRNASSPDRYQRLIGVIDGEITQLMADETEALPYIGSTLLDTFKARIQLLTQYGENTTLYQQQYADDAKELASAKTLADYLTLAQTVNKQSNMMSLPLVRGKARSDLATLQQLIANTQLINPLLAYEYANHDVGVGDATDRFNQAARDADIGELQAADDDILTLSTNLRAMLDNLRDPTSPGQPHQADLQLMQQYGIMSGKVIMVSLREQVARLYNNGKLEYWSDVTTGRPEVPSPPGLHMAYTKDRNIQFKSSAPKNSPLWYGPTQIYYAIYYADYGFYLHDAWWRNKFGPGSNLPHNGDGLAFNGGSHGCVNFPEANMIVVFNWAELYIPIVLY